MTSKVTYRVLVVDDEASVLITYRLILEQQGYAVVACSTAREAIQAIARQKFDVVLDANFELQKSQLQLLKAIGGLENWALARR